MTANLVALVLAVGAAATFGLSTSLQHLVSSRLGTSRPDRMMLTLIRTPTWVLGMSLSVVAFVLHALALSAGALMVVQPVIVTGVVFAVFIRAALDRRAPTYAEVAWASVTWAGLALFLTGTGVPAPAVGLPAHPGVFVVVLLGAVLLAAVAAGRCPDGSVAKGMWLGVVSGVLFGLVAVLLKLTLAVAASGASTLVVSWAPWLMVGCGSCAVLVNQRAYQTAPLSVSMPILNVVDVLVALGFAAVVFGEIPAHGPMAVALEGVGFAAMTLGVTRLARLEDRGGAGDGVTPPTLIGTGAGRATGSREAMSRRPAAR